MSDSKVGKRVHFSMTTQCYLTLMIVLSNASQIFANADRMRVGEKALILKREFSLHFK